MTKKPSYPHDVESRNIAPSLSKLSLKK